MHSLLFLSIDSYQNQMEARYQEQSMLTNLFIENKLWGWVGLTAITICIGIILLSFYPKDEAK